MSELDALDDTHDHTDTGERRGPVAGGPPSVLVDPAKLLRVASATLAILDDVAPDDMDEGARRHLADASARLLAEVGSSLAPEAVAELHRLVDHTDHGVPTASELRLLQAQLVGWLQGVLRGEELSTWGAAVAGVQRLADAMSSASRIPRPTDGQPSPYL